MRVLIVLAMMIGAVGLTAAQIDGGACPAFAGPAGQWEIAETVVIWPDTLKCKYDAAVSYAEPAGACLSFAVSGETFLSLTVERVNAAGQLVCKYELYSTPAVTGFRAVR